MDKIKDLIQQHIKEYRASTGLPLRQFAEELGASHMSVSYWERGDRVPTLDAVMNLSVSRKSKHAVFVDDLPHTATGKISKKDLRVRLKDYQLPA